MKLLFGLLFSFVVISVQSQDIPILFKEAENLEKQQKEAEALEKYKELIGLEPGNIKALVKAAELIISLSSRITDKNGKRLYIETSLSFAKRAIEADSNHADANYAMAMALGKMTDVETENKKIVELVKEIKRYAEKSLSINALHAKAHYSLGKWHYEMVILPGLKKIAVKLFYGGLPGGDMDSAILHLEKCKSLAPYFVTNYLDLGKAYKDNHQPGKAIEILTKMSKLPTRTTDDIASKAEGAKLLASLQ